MFVDISMPIQKGSVLRKGTIPVDVSSLTFRNESEGAYETTILTMALHTATHIDLVFPEKEFPL